MRFLANENMPRDVVEALRANGHDVAWVREDAPGSPDRGVLARGARATFESCRRSTKTSANSPIAPASRPEPG